MSDPQVKKTLLELQKKDGNRICMDCNAPNPMWASVTLTTFFCLNCSGAHRGLGVHLSFVRSVNMDKWSAEQVRRMEHGGNKKALEFFKTQPDYRDGLSIKDKYTSRFADLWRQKITAECEGRSWTAPPQSVSQKKLSQNLSPNQFSNSSPSLPNRFGSTTSVSRANSQSSFSRDTNHDSSRYNSTLQSKDEQDKASKERYFSTLGAANSSRPDNLPPSQGGRYVGFGSSGPTPQPSQSDKFEPKDIIEDPGAALYKGWSLLSSGTLAAIGTLGEVAGSINENYIRPTTDKVLDPEFRSSMVGYVSSIGKKVGDQTSATLQGFSGNAGSSYGNGTTNGSYGSYGRIDNGLIETKYGNETSRNYNGFNPPVKDKDIQKKTVSNSRKDSWDDDWDNF